MLWVRSVDRSAIFVDAGYLFAAGGELCCDERSRGDLHLEAARLNEFLCGLAQASGLPVLRTYWYDGAKEAVATKSQQVIAALPNVKLRLGRLNSRNQQKGVDALIYRDLMTLARERAISEAYFLSGDEDLREGVRSVQDQGVRVTVIGIQPSGAKRHNQSRALLHEADMVLQLTKDDLATFIIPVPAQPPAQDARSTSPVPPPIEDAARSFAEQWLFDAALPDITLLRAQKPKIPSTLDGDLLRHVEQACGVSVRADETARKTLRRAFWHGIGPAPDSRDL